jgi:hypothetical protein
MALFGSAARVANSIPRPDFFYLSDPFLAIIFGWKAAS